MLVRMALVVVFGCLVWSGAAMAQVEQTPNTLKLDDSDPRPAATLADVELLVGHWKGDFLGAQAEEIWLPAAGNTMVGLFRLTSEDEVFFYEIMHMVEEEGSVSLKLKHFHGDLKGWEKKDEMVTFRFVKSTPEGLWFEGLTFLKQADGSLQSFIALTQEDGSAGEESFVYRPVGGR